MINKTGRLNFLMLMLAAFVLLCYLPYFLYTFFNGESWSTVAIALTVVILACVPTFLFIKRTCKSKVITVLKTVYIVGMAFYVVSFSSFFAYISVMGARTVSDTVAVSSQDSEPELIMVFGCRTYGYTPSKHLKTRLDTAYELLSKLEDSVCVVTGGQGSNETVAEAVAMKKYLTDKGIDPNRIYVEDKSRNTYENIEFAMKLIEKEKIEYSRIIGVSSEFHIPRIEYLYDHYGIKADTQGAPSPEPFTYFMCVVREYMAYVKLFLVTA